MKKTPLYERHLSLGASMTEFGGWAMPVQYTSIIEEHRNTRTLAGLFDVCHMGEIEIKGPQALELLQWVMSRNLANQQVGEMKLSAITNEKGGIIDDVIVYRLAEDRFLAVANAGNREPVATALAERAAELRRRFPDKKLALTEWNVTGTPTDPIRTLAGGLRTAIGLCQIAASGWEVGIYHCLYTPSFYDAFNLLAGPPDAPRLRPSGWAFKAVKEHGKRYVLETTSTYRGIYACGFAGSDSSDGSLVIVNRTENYETVTMSLPGSWKKLTVYEMTASSLNADNETANNVTLKYKATLDGSAEMTYKFPPYSLTIFDTGPR